MVLGNVWRGLRRALALVERVVRSLLGGDDGDDGPTPPDDRSVLDLHTQATYRAVVDAVVPETPELEAELGPEHVPGGLAVDLDEFVVTFVDDLFQFGLPYIGPRGNLPLSLPIAEVLDVGARALVHRGDNESDPDVERALALLDDRDAPRDRVADAVGPFAKLTREDRLRVLGIIDEFEFEASPFGVGMFEFDGGLVGQLVIGFTEMIYYSEWAGYDDFAEPPSEREHPNDPAAVGSWRQTGFPGFADGYAALRGYVGTEAGTLGTGEVWTAFGDDSPVRITHGSGSFRENDYDTSDYEEPFPEAD